MTDKQIELCRKGDKEAFTQLVTEYQQKVYATALSVMGNEADALDASQEAFIRIYKSISKFRGDSSLSTWIHKVTTNICLDMLRKQGRVKTVNIEESAELVSEDHSASPEKYLLSNERKKILKKALISLPTDLRTVFVLRDVDGLSYAEISEILSIPEGTVKSRISRARAAILASIKKNSELFKKNDV